MEQNAGPSSSVDWRELRIVLTSPSFLVGAAVLVGSVVVGGAPDVTLILLLGFGGYLVAGLLAPPLPWHTGLLLGLAHGAAALAAFFARSLLAEPTYDGPWAQMGAAMFVAGLFVLFAVGIPLGVAVTGLVGDLVNRLVRR